MKASASGDSSPPTAAQRMDALTELAMDLRWSWNHSSDRLWRRLDPELWALTGHPNVVLKTVPREALASAMSDPSFCRLVDRLVRVKRLAEAEPAWFQEGHPRSPLTCVAYFCMEFKTVQPTNGVASYLYRATVPSDRPATAYTPRIVRSCGSLAENLGWILWQR